MLVESVSPVVRKDFKDRLKFVFMPGNMANGVSFSDRLFLTFGLGAEDVRRADPSRPEDKKLLDTMERLSIKAQVPRPHLLVYDSDRPNAASMMISGSIAVANSLQKGLTDGELETVLGHELAHHAHRLRDSLWGLLAPAGLATVYKRKCSDALHARLPGRKSKLAFGAAEVATGLGGFSVYRAAYARSAEFEADRESAEMTGRPRDMINVLKALTDHQHKESVEFDRHAPPRRSFIERIFDTHPPLDERISRLETIEKRNPPTDMPQVERLQREEKNNGARSHPGISA